MKQLFYIYLIIHASLSLSFSLAQTEVSYGKNSLQKLDYYVAKKPNSPIVIVVHGGGWFKGDKSGLPYTNASKLFNKKGYAVVNINYRLTADPNPVTYPKHIEDLACALAWAKNNASLFNGDSSRVAIYGHSAGGQMGAYLGVCPNTILSGCFNTAGMNVDGVILTSATVDFDMTNPDNWHPIRKMLGNSQLWDVAQPINHCANNFDTKFLILCAQNDELWIEQDSAFHDSLTYYNHYSQLKMFTGYDHLSLISSLNATNPVFLSMIDFLDKLWKPEIMH
jgi:acetyl esterase/lipase